MNIFALSKSPLKSAQQMINKHVVKMPTETCQMLHTNALYFEYVDAYNSEPTLKELKQFHKETNSILMKPAMLNHPSTIWARQTKDNGTWLYHHGLSLCWEYTHRYGKEHGSYRRIRAVDEVYLSGDWKQATPVTIAMDDSYRIENTFSDAWEFVIQSYRHYYLEGKWRFAEWYKNRRPSWFPNNWYAVKYNEGVRKYNASFPKYPMTLLEE